MITELYERLHMDVTEFDEEDVITTSTVLDPELPPDNNEDPVIVGG